MRVAPLGPRTLNTVQERSGPMFAHLRGTRHSAWLDRWFGSTSLRLDKRARGGAPPRRVRPVVESLEGRTLLSGGALDLTFSSSGKQTVAFDLGSSKTDSANDVAIDSSGRIVVVGSALKSGTADYDFAVTRLKSDGSIDGSFGASGIQTIPFNLGGNNEEEATGVAIDANGKIVIVGRVQRSSTGDFDFGIVRLNSDGSLDTTFNSTGKRTVFFDLGGTKEDEATDVAIDSNGKIVVVGFAERATPTGNFDYAVARLNSDGSLDTTFNSTGKATVAFDLGGSNADYCSCVAIDSSNRIVLGGGVKRTAVQDYDFGVARLKTDGTLDTTFNSTGKRQIAFDQGNGNDDEATGIAIDGNGKIVVVGYAQEGGTSTDHDFAIARLNSDGSSDLSFNSNGKLPLDVSDRDDFATDVAIDSKGRIVVVGYGERLAGNNDFAVIRLNTDGSLDTNFAGMGGRGVTYDFGSNNNDYCRAVAIDSVGRIVMAGSVQRVDTGDSDFGVARLAGYTVPLSADATVGQFPTGIVSGDFNGDFKLDLAVANYGPTGGNSVSVLLGFGSGDPNASTKTISLTAGTNPFAIAAGRFNSAGNLDIVTGNFTGQSICYIAGNGNGTFKAPVTIPAMDSAGGTHKIVALAIGDLNSDSKQDIVASSGDGTYTIYLGNGNGTFNALPSKSALTPIFGVAIADFNFGTGSKPGLVVAAFAANKIGVLPGNGNGTFATPVFTNVGGSTDEFLVATDFDKDGKVDVATANKDSNTVSFLRGNGSNGTFFLPQTYAVGTNPLGITVGDVNSTGELDIAVANVGGSGSSSVSLLLGRSGVFANAKSIAAGSNPIGVVIGRFNPNAPSRDVIGLNFVGTQHDTVTMATESCSIGAGSSRLVRAPGSSSPPTITGLNATRGTAGSELLITGTNFVNVQSVAFNGVQADSITVDSSTQLRVIVPVGATTGAVTVVTDSGAAESTALFKVTAGAGNSSTIDTSSLGDGTLDRLTLANLLVNEHGPSSQQLDEYFTIA